MNAERRNQIIKILLKEKKVTVSELAQKLFISEPSIRRDLTELEKEKLVRRVHGGAILEEHSESFIKIPFLLRELEDHDAKTVIAQRAAELVNDGDVVMMDASSSAYAIIPFLAQKNNVTVITSGIKALMRLAEHGIDAYSTGGHLLSSSFALVDEDAHEVISHYNADIAFFSCRGISPDGMITDFSIEENIVRKKMIERSKKSVLLCADKKMNKTYLHNICSIREVTHVISEAELPENLKKILE
ncbi:MAG: DeoR/GlpR transcriptional regulator [Clostridia bacterium]|nr:DeoR/GlpR transcriptional regulator [Clostridia bacterium]